MVTYDQFECGVISYLEREMLPRLGEMKRVCAAGYIALVRGNIKDAFFKLCDNPAIKATGCIDEQKNINEDRLYDAFAPQFETSKTVSIPMIGNFGVDRDEVNKLLRYVKEAGR